MCFPKDVLSVCLSLYSNNQRSEVPANQIHNRLMCVFLCPMCFLRPHWVQSYINLGWVAQTKALCGTEWFVLAALVSSLQECYQIVHNPLLRSLDTPLETLVPYMFIQRLY